MSVLAVLIAIVFGIMIQRDNFITNDFDSCFAMASHQIENNIVLTSVTEFDRSLYKIDEEADNCFDRLSVKYGSNNDFAMKLRGNSLERMQKLSSTVKHTFAELSQRLKDAKDVAFKEFEMNVSRLHFQEATVRLNSIKEAEFVRISYLIRGYNISAELAMKLSSHFKNETMNSLNELEEAHGWRFRNAQTEFDCRRVIIAILKQMRGEATWNEPDDNGNKFNWRENLNLSEWDGTFLNGKRIQVDGNGMITQLFLNNLGMCGELPDIIGNLTSLTYLGVSDNQLTVLPESIGNLTSLTGLWADNNQLTVLPESIGNLTSLTWLDVHNNQLTVLPESIGSMTSLTELYVC